MHLRYGEAEEAFRADLVAWLEVHAPSSEVRAQTKRSSADMPPWARAWQAELFDAGWLVPGWPPELGGRSAGPVEQMIYFEEMARRRMPRSLNPQGLGIVAPSIVDHGTDAQKERFVRPTLRGEIAWCIGMSEPNAGSDLASLRTRAVLDGDRFVVNGQKVWTSGAHHADWCVCYVRTDPEAPKHRGISALIVDMRSAGVETRPFPELTDPDYCDFNEVFLTDVVVPAENLLGPLHGGWGITQGSLAHERAMLWIDFAASVDRTVQALTEVASVPGPSGVPRSEDGVFRDRLARAAIDAAALRCLGYRGFSKFMRGRAAPEHSLLKLFGGESLQRTIEVALDALGPAALDAQWSGPPLWRQGSWGEQWLRSFAATIPGGTSEIQRNIIAERILGLPRA